MNKREEVIAYCLTFPGVYEDYPFRDHQWATMRCRKNRKIFAFIYERNHFCCINVKCDPEWIEYWRNAFDCITAGYHMNKKYWNTIILDGTVPEADICRMIGESYDLVRERR